jgi:hypothetical protein
MASNDLFEWDSVTGGWTAENGVDTWFLDKIKGFGDDYLSFDGDPKASALRPHLHNRRAMGKTSDARAEKHWNSFQKSCVGGYISNLCGISKDHICVCGGAALSAVCGCVYGDIDVYLVDVPVEKGEELAKGIVGITTGLMLPDTRRGVWYKRSDFAITISGIAIHGDKYGKVNNHVPVVQIVLAKESSVKAILSSFDVDCCCFAIMGTRLFALRRGLMSMANGAIPFRPEHVNAYYDSRLGKYYSRGFDILIPKTWLQSFDEVDKAIFAKRQGLGKLNDPTADNSGSYYADKLGHCDYSIAFFGNIFGLGKTNTPFRCMASGTIGPAWRADVMAVSEGDFEAPVSIEARGRMKIAIKIMKQMIMTSPLEAPLSLDGAAMRARAIGEMSHFQQSNWMCKSGGVAPIERENKPAIASKLFIYPVEKDEMKLVGPLPPDLRAMLVKYGYEEATKE